MSAMDNCGFEGDNCTTFIEMCDEQKNTNQEKVCEYVESGLDYEINNYPKCLKIKEVSMLKRCLSKLFPPTGVFAVALCLMLSTIAVFLVARCVLGEIASIGGTVFALMVLVVVALT